MFDFSDIQERSSRVEPLYLQSQRMKDNVLCLEKLFTHWEVAELAVIWEVERLAQGQP